MKNSTAGWEFILLVRLSVLCGPFFQSLKDGLQTICGIGDEIHVLSELWMLSECVLTWKDLFGDSEVTLILFFNFYFQYQQAT